MKLAQTTTEMEEMMTEDCYEMALLNMGFECKGFLRDYPDYSEFSERFWVWVKYEGDNIYIVAAFDLGGNNYDVCYKNLFIKELVII